MATRKKTIDFEQSLIQLEQIVQSLESGELSLEESLKAFEKGIKLTADCQSLLSEAEQKVEMLTTDATGQMQSKPLDPVDNDQ